ncbi:MAG: hypothetical protein WAW99_04140 [Candidatus Bipolaricaulis anaerobius]
MRRRLLLPVGLTVLLVASLCGRGSASSSNLVAVLDEWVFGNPDRACAWEESRERVLNEIRGALFADLAQGKESESLQLALLLPLAFAESAADYVSLDPRFLDEWQCMGNLAAIIVAELRAVGRERGVEQWERSFLGAGQYFQARDKDIPLCLSFFFVGRWLRDTAIPRLAGYTVLRLAITNRTEEPIRFGPSARILMMDATGRQHLPYTAFSAQMLHMLDQPFYRDLWGNQMVIYPGQTIMVYLPYDKVKKPVRLIFEDFEGSRSPAFYLDLFF